MPLGKRGKIGALLAILLLISGVGFSAWHRRESSGRSNIFEVIPTANQNGETPATAGDVVIADSSKGNALAGPFESGSLPQPLPVSDDNADSAAIELAKRVAANDDKSAAAFLAAVQMAGIGVRSPDGALLPGGNNPGQGIALHDWEVAAMLKLYGQGLTLKLQDVSEGIKKNFPEFRDAPVAELILKSVGGDMNSDKPDLRFWARFLAGLWLHSPRTCDLQRGDCDPATVHLDPLQFTLILHRLAGDLTAHSSGAHTKAGSRRFFPRRNGPWTLTNASTRSSCGVNLIMTNYVDTPAPAAPPKLPSCLTDGTIGTIMDIAALGLNTGFGQLISYLEEKGVSGTGAYGRSATIATLLLTYVNFVATYATLETKITMENAPLVRTKNSEPGQLRKLTAHVTQSIGNWQSLNCLRLALNALGIDAGLPADGSVAGAELQWLLLEGGNQWNSDTRVLTHQIVGFKNPGQTIQDGGEATNFTVTTTDDKGFSFIDLEGSPQRSALSDKAVPVAKQAVIQFTIAVKPATLSGDAISVAGVVISGPVGLLTVPLEMLYRARWYPSKTYTAPVTDWQECAQGWTGEVTRTIIVRKEQMSSGQGRTEALVNDGEQIDSWKLSGKAGGAPQFAHTVGGTLTDTSATWEGKVTGSRTDRVSTNVALGGKCSGTSLHSENVIEDKSEGEGTGGADLVVLTDNSGRAEITINPHSDDPPGPIRRTRSVHGSTDIFLQDGGCGHRTETTTAGSGAGAPDNFRQVGPDIDTTVDPNQPNILTGTKTISDAEVGSTITITWNLRRCP
jgi:hypothetical protein